MSKVDERIIINNASELQHHFESILPALHLVESEDTWQKIEKSLIKLEVITKSGGYKYDVFPSLFKSVAQPIINSLLSERTKLSGTAADLLNSVAPRLGDRFESLINVFTPSLLLICARTNKVALVRAKKCLLLIAKHCKLISLLPHLREASKDKSQTARSVSVEVTLMLLESMENKDRLGKRVTDLETIIKGTATDRDPEVRQWCKKVFEVYTEIWPDRVMDFTSTFTPTTRRYLALSKDSSASIASSNRLSPPPARRPQQSREHIVKLKGAASKPRTHLAPISANATPSIISPLAYKQAKPTSATVAPNQALSKSKVQRKPSAEIVQSTPVSRKASGSAAIVDPQEEQQRAALRAELVKQATGTPSQSVAARLALEKFEFQLKKIQQLETQEEESTASSQSIETSQSRGTDRMLFNVAMSKKQSPRKGPSRVIVVAPTNASRKVSKESIATTTSASGISASSSSSRSHPNKIQCEEPDVFRSRPISNTTALQTISATSSPKVSSSISRGLGAREKLLGPSMRAANKAAKLSGTKSRSGVKKASLSSPLKIDVGKENIPPGSMLGLIAEPALEPVTPNEEIHQEEKNAKVESIPTMTITSAPVLPLPDKVVPIEMEEIKSSINREEQEATAAPTDTLTSYKEKLEVFELVAEENEQVTMDRQIEEASIDAALIPLPPSSEAEGVAGVEVEAEAEAEIEKETPLSDWTLLSAALQENVPISAPVKNNEFHPAKIRVPSMSTPLRQPLDSTPYDNVVTSLSSPLSANVQIVNKHFSPLQISPKKDSRLTPSAHLRKIFSIVASRKM